MTTTEEKFENLRDAVKRMVAQMDELMESPNETADAHGLAYHVSETLGNALWECSEEEWN